MYHWASKKSFSSVAEIFPKVPIIAWGFAFPCNPWLFSKGICSKLFSLHLTRSFELRKVYILLWIWRMRKNYEVECEHSVRFWFEYLISGLKRYRTFRETDPWPQLFKRWIPPLQLTQIFTKLFWPSPQSFVRSIYQASCKSDIVRKNNFARH